MSALDDFSTPTLLVAYRADLRQLTGRWLGSVTEAELHQDYAALRRVALHHACGSWLIDSRRRTNRSLNGPEWVTTQFLPQVQQALGCPLRVYFLVLPNYLATLPPEPPTPAPAEEAVRYARFVDEGGANVWLANQPPRG